MGFIANLRAYFRVLRRRKRPMEHVKLLRRRPALLLGVNAYEMALAANTRVDGHLKALAQIKAAMLVGCLFWLDIGSAVGREMGVSEQQLLALASYESSDAFDDAERAVLDLAVAMTKIPTDVSPELKQRLGEHFDERQQVELAAAIAWENYRARFNRVFGVGSSGFSEGAFCVLPQRS